MRRVMAAAVAAAILALAPTGASAQDSKYLSDLYGRVSKTMAILEFKIDPGTGNARTVRGQAVCIDANGGIFMTPAFDARADVDSIKDLRLIAPGADSKSYAASLMGVEPSTGLGFVKLEEKADFAAVQFVGKSNLKPGDRVASVGLLGDAAHTPALGTGFVSAELRVPAPLVKVTGGKLTRSGSPVFDVNGNCVGLVTESQLITESMAMTQRGMAPFRSQGVQETMYFSPVESFVYALGRIPSGGKIPRLPWMGVANFSPVPDVTASVLKLDQPAVQISDVIPGHPADKAGMKNQDVIIAVNGKPIEKLGSPELTAQNLQRQILMMKVGEKVSFTVLREGKKEQATVTLSDMPAMPQEAKRFGTRLGFIAREKVLIDQYLDKSPTAMVPGLIVQAVYQRSPAAAGGLRPQDVIMQVNGQVTTKVEGIKEILDEAVKKPSEPIKLLVRRGNQNVEVVINIPNRE